MSDTKVLEALAQLQRQLEETRQESRERGERTNQRLQRIDERFDRVDDRLARGDGSFDLITGQMHSIAQRQTKLEERLTHLEDGHLVTRRQSFQGDEAQSAALHSAMMIQTKAVESVRGEVGSVRDEVALVKGEVGDVKGELAAIRTELEIPKPGDSQILKPSRTKLETIKLENKSALILQIVITLGLLAQAVRQALAYFAGAH